MWNSAKKKYGQKFSVLLFSRIEKWDKFHANLSKNREIREN